MRPHPHATARRQHSWQPQTEETVQRFQRLHGVNVTFHIIADPTGMLVICRCHLPDGTKTHGFGTKIRQAFHHMKKSYHIRTQNPKPPTP